MGISRRSILGKRTASFSVVRMAVAVMVSVALGVSEVCAQGHEAFLKTFRDRDAGNGADGEALQCFQRMALTGEHILQIQRLVGALDDFSLIVELANGLAQLFCAEFARFGDE